MYGRVPGIWPMSVCVVVTWMSRQATSVASRVSVTVD
jgi:hypothetical protein